MKVFKSAHVGRIKETFKTEVIFSSRAQDGGKSGSAVTFGLRKGITDI